MTITLTPDSIDKWFKTRDGRKVKCIYRTDGGLYVMFHPEADRFFYTYLSSADDIISEWHEPIEREVTVYMANNGHIVFGKNYYPSDLIIASAKVKLIEGKFHE